MTFKVGDQVKVVARDHGWFGAIGTITRPSENRFLDWVIELETIAPGQQAQAAESELRRV